MRNFKEPEGATPLDPDEMEGLKFKHITTRGELDHLEQANIQEGLQWLARQKTPDIFSVKFARQLHQKLFGQVWLWAGTYRQTGKNIGVDPAQIGVQLRSVLDDARYWVEHETYEPLEAAVRFHYRLVFIHPFPNGNGRFSRIMGDIMMEEVFGLPAVDWTAGADLQAITGRRKQYIAALRAADRGDFDLLMAFVGHATSPT